MYHDKKISVIIAAAGFGKRMGGSINKQYMHIGGMPVLARTIRCFELHRAVDEIILAVKEEDIASCRKDIVDFHGFRKVTEIVAGGKERQDSVYEALKVIGDEDGYVLVHDGARPLITEEQINGVLDMAQRHGAAAVGVPVKDTIKVTDEEGCILGTPDRKTLYAVQTPQAFEAKLIRQAFDHAFAKGFYGTDETVLLEKMGKKVYISKGSYTNIKITTPEDIVIGEAILRERDANRNRI